MAGTSPAMTMDRLYVALKRAADQVVKRDRAAAAYEEIEHRDRPHQGVFEPELVPEISADTPALHVGDEQEDHDRDRGHAGEQAERKHWPADELRQRDRRRPRLAGPIAVGVELLG